MVPVIRIADKTYERLQERAIPLEDRPDDVIRKLLDIAEKTESVAARCPDRRVPDSESTDIKEQHNFASNGSSSGPITFDIPGNLMDLNKKARGKVARDTYLGVIGHEQSPRHGMFVKVSDDQWRLVEYATLSRSTGKWWFGAKYSDIATRLKRGALEDVVFLCGEENGTVVTATLSAGRLERILDRLSQSKDGQVKFNLRRRVDRRFEITISDRDGSEILV